MAITVRRLLQDPMLGLRVVSGEQGLDRPITTAELNRPALELAGFFAEFRSERIQVFGAGELSYVQSHWRDTGLAEILSRVLGGDVPCAIVTNGREPAEVMCLRSEAAAIPILTCPHHTTKLYKRLWEHLEPEFAPETTVHGVLMEVHEIGVLIQGKSSVGKSECGLELIRRGFRLVADDFVTIRCLNDSILVGRGSKLLPFHMEARGLGIIDVSRLFGAISIRNETRVRLVISLVEWEDSVAYDRTGLTEDSVNILDVQVPHVTIPVKPGRSVGTLVEIAALNQKLKNMGINTAQLMEQTLTQQMLAGDVSGSDRR
ncbi:MAG: HPr(Ser) kinase/phosphatase [Rhodocyclaceae bacterium]